MPVKVHDEQATASALTLSKKFTTPASRSGCEKMPQAASERHFCAVLTTK
jgi:hypothetical protein